MQNYSQLSLFLTVVGSLSQNAFLRLCLFSVIRRQYELVETFLHVCILAVQMWRGMSSTEAQPWKFFTYDHLLSVFHLQCNDNAVETTTTTSSWRALTSDDFLMCARDRSSAHAQSNWAEKVRLLSTYSQSWNWPGLLQQMLNYLFFSPHHKRALAIFPFSCILGHEGSRYYK